MPEYEAFKEFLSAGAAISAGLWAVTLGLFTFIGNAGVGRLRDLSFVSSTAIAVAVTNNIFLFGTLGALYALVPPGNTEQFAAFAVPLGGVAWALLLAAAWLCLIAWVRSSRALASEAGLTTVVKAVRIGGGLLWRVFIVVVAGVLSTRLLFTLAVPEAHRNPGTLALMVYENIGIGCTLTFLVVGWLVYGSIAAADRATEPRTSPDRGDQSRPTRPHRKRQR